MDIAGRLQQLQELVEEAKSMPLSSSVLINRDEVLDLLREMQEDLPEEIKQARWIVKDREDLLAKARAEGEKIVAQAHEEQLRLARKEEIAKRAADEADRILTEAEDKARTMRDEAEDYVDAKLAQFEIALRKILEESQATSRALAKTLDQVEVGRERLRGSETTAEQGLGSATTRSEPDAPAETPFYDEEQVEADR
jgi:F0F1-type ATP synthase membrane subunit b/b'